MADVTSRMVLNAYSYLQQANSKLFPPFGEEYLPFARQGVDSFGSQKVYNHRGKKEGTQDVQRDAKQDTPANNPELKSKSLTFLIVSPMIPIG